MQAVPHPPPSPPSPSAAARALKRPRTSLSRYTDITVPSQLSVPPRRIRRGPFLGSRVSASLTHVPVLPPDPSNVNDKRRGGPWVYVYGGFDYNTDEAFDDVHRLDLACPTEWEPVVTTGLRTVARDRYEHTAALFRNRFLVVFGGHDADYMFPRGVRALDLASDRWWSVKVSAADPEFIPKGRSKAASCVVNDVMYISGGKGNYDAQDGYVYRLKMSCVDDGPGFGHWRWLKPVWFASRYAHSLLPVRYPSSADGAFCVLRRGLLVFGGMSDQRKHHDDLVIFDLEQLEGDQDVAPDDARPVGSTHVLPPACSGFDEDGALVPFECYQEHDEAFLEQESAAESEGLPPPSPDGMAEIRDNPTKCVKIRALPAMEGNGDCFAGMAVNSTMLVAVVVPEAMPSEYLKDIEPGIWGLDFSAGIASLRWKRFDDIGSAGPSSAVISNILSSCWHYRVIEPDDASATGTGCGRWWLFGAPLHGAGRRPSATSGLDGFTPSVTAGVTQHDEMAAEYMGYVARLDLNEYGLVCIPDVSTTIAPLNFGSTLDDAEFADFTIIAKNAPEVRFPVHRVILAARWPYFRRLYQSGASETTTSELEMSEAPGVIYAFLQYLYTNRLVLHRLPGLNGGGVPDTTTLAADLMVMANVYCLLRLQRLCCAYLHQHKVLSNASTLATVWDRAERAEEYGLRARMLREIFSNWGEVCRSPAWLGLGPDAWQVFWSQTPSDVQMVSTGGESGDNTHGRNGGAAAVGDVRLVNGVYEIL